MFFDCLAKVFGNDGPVDRFKINIQKRQPTQVCMIIIYVYKYFLFNFFYSFSLSFYAPFPHYLYPPTDIITTLITLYKILYENFSY